MLAAARALSRRLSAIAARIVSVVRPPRVGLAVGHNRCTAAREYSRELGTQVGRLQRNFVGSDGSKKCHAEFHTLYTAGTNEVEFATARMTYLREQGYAVTERAQQQGKLGDDLVLAMLEMLTAELAIRQTRAENAKTSAAAEAAWAT